MRTTDSLKKLLMELTTIRDQRKNLEDKAKALKIEEERISDEMLILMAALGLKSANFPGIGKLHMREKVRYEITDYELVLRYMLSEMVAAGRDGRPWADAQLFQKRLNETALRARLEEIQDSEKEEYLESIGVREYVKAEIALTKSA